MRSPVLLPRKILKRPAHPLRTAFYGRDRDRVLWQYQATPDPTRPDQYTGRARVGGGWNTYTSLI